MSGMLESAKLFFDACETGKGWEVCKDYCHTNASFSAQAIREDVRYRFSMVNEYDVDMSIALSTSVVNFIEMVATARNVARF